MTLLGLHPSFEPIQIGYIDTCQESVHPMNNYDNYFSEKISLHSKFISTFAIIAHDSAICVDYDLEPLFRNTGLEKWNEIDFRTSYIGIIDAKKNITEYTDFTGSSISVYARNIAKNIDNKLSSSFNKNIKTLPRVAHAGGGYNNNIYTNSIDALNYNLDYFTVFEIDFSWTSDNHLVCLHDWNNSFKNRFNVDPIGKITLKEFIYYNENNSELDICTLDTLAKWMILNKEAFIVTDIKKNNIEGLYKISKKYPELVERFIPQIYHPSEYLIAKSYGYRDIIWTLYRYREDDESVIYYTEKMDLLGITMPINRAKDGLAQRIKDATGVLSWVHTINTIDEYNFFKNLGVNQIYTDWLID